MNFFNTFRARLLIILAFLLVATLGVQLYVNLSNRRENVRVRELQEQALVWTLDVDERTAASARHKGGRAGHVEGRGFDLGVVAHLAFLSQDGADVLLEELGLIRLRDLGKG